MDTMSEWFSVCLVTSGSAVAYKTDLVDSVLSQNKASDSILATRITNFSATTTQSDFVIGDNESDFCFYKDRVSEKVSCF